MTITHKEAEQLIQLKADGSLGLESEEMLRAHVQGCGECRRYLETTQDTENILRSALRKQWNVVPPPLQMDVVYLKTRNKGMNSYLLATRTALASVVAVMLVFMVWHSISGNDGTSSQNLISSALLVPTPSMPPSVTLTAQDECENFKYRVREGDTFESIAGQFAVSKESLLSVNGLTEDSLQVLQVLVIPICETTPTSTTHPPTFTITPKLEPITTTPG